MWKNLNEERPTKGQKVLICYQAFGEYEYAIAEYLGYEEYFTTVGGRVLFSTHWMPLMPPDEL